MTYFNRMGRTNRRPVGFKLVFPEWRPYLALFFPPQSFSFCLSVYLSLCMRDDQCLHTCVHTSMYIYIYIHHVRVNVWFCNRWRCSIRWPTFHIPKIYYIHIYMRNTRKFSFSKTNPFIIAIRLLSLLNLRVCFSSLHFFLIIDRLRRLVIAGLVLIFFEWN